MDLLQIWVLARRNWRPLLASLALGLGLAVVVSWLQPQLYAASTTGYVVAGTSQTVGDAFAGKNLAAEKAATYLPLVQSRSVADGVAAELGIDAAEVRLDASNEGVIFTLTATASSPELARAMADAGIRATSTAANDLETMTVSGEGTGQTVVGIIPVEMANTPTAPVSPNWSVNLALGVFLGLLAGAGALVARDRLDVRVRRPAELEQITGAAALGVIPAAEVLAEKTDLTGDRSAAAETLRKLRTNLRFVSVDKPLRTLVVTSPNEGEGKSTIATHLARLLADSGRPTILVDADLRRPRLAGHFGVDGGVGLTQVLVGEFDLDDAIRPLGRGLTLLPAGAIPPNPSELVGSDRMRAVIDRLALDHTVVIDAPPLLPVTDAGLLTAAADGALLVVQHGRTLRDQVALAVRNLEQVNGRLFGFVLNRVPRKDVGAVVYGNGTSTYHSHYLQEQPPNDPAPATARRAPRRAKHALTTPDEVEQAA